MTCVFKQSIVARLTAVQTHRILPTELKFWKWGTDSMMERLDTMIERMDFMMENMDRGREFMIDRAEWGIVFNAAVFHGIHLKWFLDCSQFGFQFSSRFLYWNCWISLGPLFVVFSFQFIAFKLNQAAPACRETFQCTLSKDRWMLFLKMTDQDWLSLNAYAIVPIVIAKSIVPTN